MDVDEEKEEVGLDEETDDESVSIKPKKNNFLKTLIKRFFAPPEKELVGIDIGHSAVKVALVSGNEIRKKYVLKRYASVPLTEGAIIDHDIQKKEEIVDAVKEALENAGIQEKDVCIGLSGPDTVTKKLQVADGTDEEIEDQVLWEAEHYLPFSSEEGTVGIGILGANENDGIDVMVGAAKNVFISEMQEIMEEAELKVKIIDLNTLALSNIFELTMLEVPSKKGESWLTLDMGSQSTLLIIYKNKEITFTKNLSIGGNSITEEIQRQMSVTYEEAENLKKSDSESSGVPEEISAIIDNVLDLLIVELEKIVTFYHNTAYEKSLKKCYLTGGNALTVGFLEKMENKFEFEVSVINPLEKIKVDEKNIDDDLNDVLQKGAVSIGLAMRRS